MRKLSILIEIEDNDLIEHNTRQKIQNDFNVVSLTTLPNIDHLKENATYKKLRKAKKDAKLVFDRYINSNRE